MYLRTIDTAHDFPRSSQACARGICHPRTLSATIIRRRSRMRRPTITANEHTRSEPRMAATARLVAAQLFCHRTNKRLATLRHSRSPNMGNSSYWLVLKTLCRTVCVLWMLHLPPSAGNDPLSSILDEPIGIHEIRLLHALQSQPRVDQDGKPMESYKDLYETFQRRTDCIPWETLVNRWHSHEEIKTLAHNCLCTSIRNALVSNVHKFTTSAPQGQLPAIYLARGLRHNVFKRLIIRMHSDAAMLLRYDALVDECFTQFFQRVAAKIQPIDGAADAKSATASAPPKPQAAESRPSEPFTPTDSCGLPWVLLVLLLITAVACTVLFVHHILLWRPTRLLPPSTVTAAAAVDGMLARTDDVAHDD